MKAELVLGNLKREREALNNKLERLEQALDKEWQDEDQEYLCAQQYNAMSLYAHILDERIIDIECKLEERKAKCEFQDQHEDTHENGDIFKKNIDFESYKNYVNSDCKCKHCDDIDPSNKIIELIKIVFGEDVLE